MAKEEKKEAAAEPTAPAAEPAKKAGELAADPAVKKAGEEEKKGDWFDEWAGKGMISGEKGKFF